MAAAGRRAGADETGGAESEGVAHALLSWVGAVNGLVAIGLTFMIWTALIGISSSLGLIRGELERIRKALEQKK
jgi:hypothetical protein